MIQLIQSIEAVNWCTKENLIGMGPSSGLLELKLESNISLSVAIQNMHTLKTDELVPFQFW